MHKSTHHTTILHFRSHFLYCKMFMRGIFRSIINRMFTKIKQQEIKLKFEKSHWKKIRER